MQAHVKNTTSIENKTQTSQMEKLIENLKPCNVFSCSLSKKPKNAFLQILTSYKIGSLFVAFL
jgi:predicted nucleic acid binding AN1-type Zn finger protein